MSIGSIDWTPEQNAMFRPSPLDLVEKGGLAHAVRNVVLEQFDLKQPHAAQAYTAGSSDA
jgi:hypothetical protein